MLRVEVVYGGRVRVRAFLSTLCSWGLQLIFCKLRVPKYALPGGVGGTGGWRGVECGVMWCTFFRALPIALIAAAIGMDVVLFRVFSLVLVVSKCIFSSSY